jgi:zinc/manganese transport system permease protein
MSILSHPFMVNALLAGTAVGASCGAVGYFLVIRNQVFTADALSHAAFTGSLAALAAGVDLRFGLFAATITVAVVMGLLGRGGKADDVVIGAVFVWVLGLGVLFLSIFTRSASGANGTAGVSVLFGSIFGLSVRQAQVSAGVCAAVVLSLIVMARPLLFASLDEAVAGAAGVPVRSLGIVFLVVVGVTAAETTQAVGALLLLGLLAAPAAAAKALTDRPMRGLALAAALGVVSVWVGLSIAYLFPRLPPSFAVIAVAVGLYAGTSLAKAVRGTGRKIEGVHA